MIDSKPDWENFAKAILTDWPTDDLDGYVLFDLSLEYGMIQEVPGGFNPDHHIDTDGICPEEGDPWYECTFRGEAGPGLYSINDMFKRIEKLEAKLKVITERSEVVENANVELGAKLAKAVEHFKKLRRRQDCLETFDAVVNEVVETALAELTGGSDCQEESKAAPKLTK